MFKFCTVSSLTFLSKGPNEIHICKRCQNKVLKCVFFQMMLSNPVVLSIYVCLLFVNKNMAALSESECLEACLPTVYDQSTANAICQACVADPPLGMRMCAAASRYPENENLQVIAEKCVAGLALTDRMCIISCTNSRYPHFWRLCHRCRADPPKTALLCRYACDNTVEFSSVCSKCAEEPPASRKLCDYACKDINKQYHIYYKRMCFSCRRM